MRKRAWLLAAAAGAAAIVGLALVRCEGTPPNILTPASLIVGRGGRSVEIRVVDEGVGLAAARAVLVEARGEHPLLEKRFAPEGAWPWSPRPHAATLTLKVDPSALELREGRAFLRITARDGSWRHRPQGNPGAREIPVQIDLTPPRIRLESRLTYVQRGGSAAAVYVTSETSLRDGVEVGKSFFRGFPLLDGSPAGDPGTQEGAGRRVALFAIPVDAPSAPAVEVVAVDPAGNRTAVPLPAHVLERQFSRVSIPLSRRFLEGSVRELARAQGIQASDPVAAFREINTTQRARDEARIQKLARTGSAKRYFQGAFEQLRNSKVTSRFAERRTYRVHGERVSEATHFGFDLATVAGGPVTAGNAGTVLAAEDLGIYGLCVLIDHGWGLVTLYGHLSSTSVRVGDFVEKGETIGRSGQTGLAGGDHLHFAMLIDGVYVDPMEWWDGKWLREHIEARLAPPRR